jgi:hypothetical protein
VNFARRVFRLAAVYGLLVLAPQYFMEVRVGSHVPPPIERPEHFYGFVGLALVWQLAFLVIARDPVRYRLFMPVAILEKLAFGVPALVLFLQGRVETAVLAFGLVDLVLGALFLLAWRRTPALAPVRTAPTPGAGFVH